MKILLSASGSGGHITPCIGFINHIKNQNIEYEVIVFKKIDEEIYQRYQIIYHFVDDRLSFTKKIRKIDDILHNFQPNCILTFGGKNSLFVNLAGVKNKIPFFIFEQNVIFGKANKISYLLCKKAFTNLKLNGNYKKEYCIGNPIILNKNSNIPRFNLKKPCILFTMGSLGSTSVLKVLEKFIKAHEDFNYYLILGKNGKTSLKNAENLKVFQTYSPLTSLLENCDIVCSRAGASTLNEIIYFLKPCILIPSPYVTCHHQEKNAKYIKKITDCQLILEDNLTVESLYQAILEYILKPTYYEKVKENMKKLIRKNSCEAILQELKQYDI